MKLYDAILKLKKEMDQLETNSKNYHEELAALAQSIAIEFEVSGAMVTNYLNLYLHIKNEYLQEGRSTSGDQKWVDSEFKFIKLYLEDQPGLTKGKLYAQLSKLLPIRSEKAIQLKASKAMSYGSPRTTAAGQLKSRVPQQLPPTPPQKEQKQEMVSESKTQSEPVKETPDLLDSLTNIISLSQQINDFNLDVFFAQISFLMQRAAENSTNPELLAQKEAEIAKLKANEAELIQEMNKIRSYVEDFANLKSSEKILKLNSYGEGLEYMVNKFGNVDRLVKVGSSNGETN